MRNFEQLVKEFAEIELKRSSHVDNPEDYDSTTEFYLSNVKKDSYKTYLEDNLTEEEREQYDIIDLWDAIKDYIIERSENNE